MTTTTDTRSGTLLYDSQGRVRALWRVLICLAIFLGISRGQLALARWILYGNIYGVGAEGSPWRTDFRFHVYAVQMLLVSLLLTLAFWGMRRWLDKRDLASIGICTPARRWYASIWVGLALGVLPMLIGGLIMIATGQYIYEGLQWGWTPLVIGTALIFAAFREEILTRGYLLNTVRESSNVAVGVIVSSVIFWLLHWQNEAMWNSPWPSVNLFLGGVVLAALYLISGNIWFVTAAHWGWNAAQGVLFDIPVSGNRLGGLIRIALPPQANEALTGGDFGAEGSALAVIPNLIFALALLAWLWKWGGCALPKSAHTQPEADA